MQKSSATLGRGSHKVCNHGMSLVAYYMVSKPDCILVFPGELFKIQIPGPIFGDAISLVRGALENL